MTTSTTIGLSVHEVERTYREEALAIHPTVPQQVRVFAPGVAFEADVVVELQRLQKAPAHDGGGYSAFRVGAILLTRDEALNLGRAIARALGVHPLAFLDESDLGTIDEGLEAALSSLGALVETRDEEALPGEEPDEQTDRARDFLTTGGELLDKVRAVPSSRNPDEPTPGWLR